MYACMWAHAANIAALVAAGADANLTDAEGKTASDLIGQNGFTVAVDKVAAARAAGQLERNEQLQRKQRVDCAASEEDFDKSISMDVCNSE